MKCDAVERLLPDLAFDNALSAEDVAMAMHLRDCIECAGRLERECRIATLLREWSEPEYGDADREVLRTSVRAAIANEAAGSRGFGSATRFAVAASIAAVALLLGLAFLGRIGSPSDNEAMAGPATRAEGTEPGMFIMVGPFTRKETVDARRSAETPRRSLPKARRVVRRTSEPRKAATPIPGLGAVDSDSMMRFEFQTEDPKIRIIWFVPKAEGATDSATEIGD